MSSTGALDQERIDDLIEQLDEANSALASMLKEFDKLKRIVESSSPLAAMQAENSRLRRENSVLQERNDGLMNEKNTAIAAARLAKRKAILGVK